MRNFFKIAFTCISLIHIVACTPVTAQHGNMLEDHQISEVVVGQHSRMDVLHILGSPTTQSTFNADIWYYIGQESEKRGILDQDVKQERIVQVTFDQKGIVQSVEDINSERMDIPYTRNKTLTHGNELTFMQQLLGNMGRFNAPQGNN